MTDTRLVAVLGYSDGSGDELHPVCAARLERGAEEARSGDAVLLTGWARRRRRASEAELMARAWAGPRARVFLDRDARSTYGNAVAAAKAARALSSREVVLVTSGWHGRRASTLLRAALQGTPTQIVLATTDERGTRRARLRELVCWTLVPFQTGFAARRR